MNRMRSRLLIVFLIFGMMVMLHGTEEVSAQSKPKIVVDSAFHDYGEVMRGTTVSHAFVIKNQGNADLIIRDAKPG